MSDIQPASSSASEAARVLLVDDNPTNLQVLSKTLEGRGFELLVARNGPSALNIARKARPGLILLDIMMPDMDGFEVCQRLKTEEATRDIAVIFLSALGEAKEKVKGLDLGAVDYITKPFQAEEVIARVNTHLTIRRLQLSLSERNQQLVTLNARMKRSLEAAAQVQRDLLPKQLPLTERARFAWVFQPCDELAGDSLNVFPIGPHHIGLFVLDVSGHGVDAALLSVAITHALTPRVDPSSIVTRPHPDGPVVASPAEVAGQLNRMFPMSMKEGHFATLIYGVLEPELGLFKYTNAGHPDPVLVRPGNRPTAHQLGGMPIGVAEGTKYEEIIIPLQAGDRLFLYSDGLIEAMNPTGEHFGKQRFFDFLIENQSVTLEESVQLLKKQIVSWSANQSLQDDLSILAIEMQ